MTDELESIVRLANRYIEEGRSVRLYSTIRKSHIAAKQKSISW